MPKSQIHTKMKTRIFSLVLLLVLAVTLQAQTYDQLWKNVEQMKQKDLPKSVIAEAQRIYDKAKKERNVPQMMKAYLTMMDSRGSITPDSIPVDVKGLEEWAIEKATQPGGLFYWRRDTMGFEAERKRSGGSFWNGDRRILQNITLNPIGMFCKIQEESRPDQKAKRCNCRTSFFLIPPQSS